MSRGLILKLISLFVRKKTVFFLSLAVLAGILLTGVARLNITESILSALPDSEDFKELSTLMESKKLSNQVFISLQFDEAPSTEDLQPVIADFADSLKTATAGNLTEVIFRRENAQENIYQYLYQKFPLLIDSSYYRYIEGKTEPDSIAASVSRVKKQLLVPGATFLQDYLLNDPLFLSSRFFQETGAQQGQGKFRMEDGMLLSEDGRTVLITAYPSFESGDSGKSGELYEHLEEFRQQWESNHPGIKLIYFGNFEIAARNAAQVKKDTTFTMVIALVIIICILIMYYRKWLIPVFVLLPTLFGALFALGIIGWIKESVSGISLATGAVLMGITLDYALHFFTHLKHTRSVRETISEITAPMLTGSFTTIAAFIALLFANSPVLRDFGLVACLALMGAGIFTILILPSLLEIFHFDFEKSLKKERTFILFASLDKTVGKLRFPLTFLLFLLTTFFLYHSDRVRFEDNLNNLSLYTSDLAEKEQSLTHLDPVNEKKIYLFASGSSMNQAMERNFRAYEKLKEDFHQRKVSQFVSAAPYLIPLSVSQQKYETWHQFWNEDNRKEKTFKYINEQSDIQGFEPDTFNQFEQLITEPETFDDQDLATLLQASGMENLIDTSFQKYTLITPITVPNQYLKEVKQYYSAIEGIKVFDRGAIASAMISNVKEDFNYLLSITAGLVFISLLIVYGRIELTLLSFMPMALSWIWILGISGLLDIRFNFVNVVVSTFIFGLGDDYSIFTTDGLLNRYKYGKNSLASYTSAIILSALTTIIGTGALIFAVHPAIHSISALSVLGISCIVLFSIIFQPLFFRLFVQDRVDRGVAPFTFTTFLLSILSFFLYGFTSILTTLSLPFIMLLPVSRKKKRNLVNQLLSFFARLIIYSGVHVRKRYDGLENLDTSRPALYIANHSSSLDNLLVIMKHPKLVMMVKGWVYNSPFFGLAVRYAGYLHTGDDPEKNIEKIRQLASDGYSVLIFPEGTRSPDGLLHRFHKGAFYLAERLGMDIQPMILNGASFVMPKGVHNIRKGALNIRYLPRVKAGDLSWGKTYQERAKSITRWYKEEYAGYRQEREDTWLLKQRIMSNYIYKGPVLEWYFKTKWELEKTHYEFYHQQIGDRTRILDMGCGYGYLSFYLHYKDQKRLITGIDYDEEKIQIAAHCYDKTDSLTFRHGDLKEYNPEISDVIFFNDVIHYLPEEAQAFVLQKFIDKLNAGGILFIRDGITDFAGQHEATLKTEKLSTGVFNFNKTANDLHFFSARFIEEMARANQMDYQMIRHSDTTSNVLFILRKP